MFDIAAKALDVYLLVGFNFTFKTVISVSCKCVESVKSLVSQKLCTQGPITGISTVPYFH